MRTRVQSRQLPPRGGELVSVDCVLGLETVEHNVGFLACGWKFTLPNRIRVERLFHRIQWNEGKYSLHSTTIELRVFRKNIVALSSVDTEQTYL